MGNVIDPTSILEQIKRARLYNPNFGAGQSPAPVNTTIAPQGQPQIPTQASPQQTPQNNQQSQFPSPIQNPASSPQSAPQQPVSSPNSQTNQITPLKTGNIDLTNRPIVKNSDGTTSTVSTITIEEDGHAVLLPTIINGQRVSEDQAIDHYKKTGEHMGIFDTEEHADQYDKQLHNQMGWNGPPGGSQEAWQKGQVQPPAQTQISPRDQALSDYRQIQQQGAPSQSDYHPSVMRRIIAGLVGGIAGLKDPKSGYEIGHGIANSQYDRALTDYQKKLAQKKEAFETEEGAESSLAKTQEQIAQKGAETARAGAEEARRKGEEYKISPAGQEFEREKLKIEHPNAPKLPVPYELELKNGETVVGYEGQNGQFKDAEGNIYGTDAIKNARKVGTSSPKGTEEKNRNEYNDYYNGMKSKYPKMTDNEISESYKKIGPPQKDAPSPIVIGPDGKVIALRPGTIAPEGYETPGQKGSDTQGTSTTRTMTEMAPRVGTLVDKVLASVDAQTKSLGPASSRWSEFWAGKVGEPNPEFTKLRTDTMLLQTLLMRMHTGSRGSKEQMDHFRDLIDFGKQSPENMKAALGEIKSYVDNIKSGKGLAGENNTPQTSKPKTKEDFLKLLEAK